MSVALSGITVSATRRSNSDRYMSVTARSLSSMFSRSLRATSAGQMTMSAPASLNRSLFLGLFATAIMRGTPNSLFACLVAARLTLSSSVVTMTMSACEVSASLRTSGLEPSALRMVASEMVDASLQRSCFFSITVSRLSSLLERYRISCIPILPAPMISALNLFSASLILNTCNPRCRKDLVGNLYYRKIDYNHSSLASLTTRFRGLLHPLNDVLRDNQPHDFRGPLPNSIESRISPVPVHIKLVRITIASMYLNRFITDPQSMLASEDLGLGSLRLERLPSVLQVCCSVDHHPRRVDIRQHVRKFRLYHFKV